MAGLKNTFFSVISLRHLGESFQLAFQEHIFLNDVKHNTSKKEKDIKKLN